MGSQRVITLTTLEGTGDYLRCCGAFGHCAFARSTIADATAAVRVTRTGTDSCGQPPYPR